MTEPVAYPYEPDMVTPPGGTLLDMLEEQGMTQVELAKRMGRPLKTINGIIRGKKAITPDTALQLEKVFGTPARFWNKREQRYQEFLARQAENEELAKHYGWLNNFPHHAMQKMGWLPETTTKQTQMVAMLQFLGIAHPSHWADIWEDCFRKLPQSPNTQER